MSRSPVLSGLEIPVIEARKLTHPGQPGLEHVNLLARTIVAVSARDPRPSSPLPAFKRVMHDYVGHPDFRYRQGLHGMPGMMRVNREKRHGIESVCTASMFDVTTEKVGRDKLAISSAGLLIVRRTTAAQWVAVRHDLLEGTTTQEQAQLVNETRGASTRAITLRVANDQMDRGEYELNLQVGDDYNATGQPIEQKWQKYYGHTGSSDPFYHREYRFDVGVLCSELGAVIDGLRAQLPRAEAANLRALL